MDDLISRQAALNTVQNMYDRCDTGSMQDYHDLLMEAFEILPPTDAVEVRHGRWIEFDDDRISGRCSVCGWESHLYEDDVVGMPYCPNCGAKMDEVE